MPPPKDDKPSVRTYADHEVITPPNKLIKVIAKRQGDNGDPIARAQAALEELSSDFAIWMQDECDRLNAARQNVTTNGFSKQSFDEIFRAAHDIKGDAATFGYPLAAPIAESLCRLIEHTPDASIIPLALLDQHVDAVRAIVREHARPDIESVAAALNARLQTVTQEFLVHANRHRPSYLDGIFSPSLAPTSF
ncbi:MAG: Hpt domain-containing protein [Pseudorhodoplanes sp.]|jgi:chemotaxis protein histidine kinase CheA|nr:Hpt domain-containing protein [Pseudorhodoplanes sp.]